jgi:hypothetical protein
MADSRTDDPILTGFICVDHDLLGKMTVQFSEASRVST